MGIYFEKNGKLLLHTECYEKLNLLAHAQLEELDIGSVCGGHGRCGKDLITLKPSDQPYVSSPTQAERKHLSRDQLKQGWRLACQCFPQSNNSDIHIEVLKP